jgi:hypothetical protein
VNLGSRGTPAPMGLLYQPRMMVMMIMMTDECGAECVMTNGRETEVREENLSACYLVHIIRVFHMTSARKNTRTTEVGSR